MCVCVYVCTCTCTHIYFLAMSAEKGHIKKNTRTPSKGAAISQIWDSTGHKNIPDTNGL